jgi:hypothetical protein
LSELERAARAYVQYEVLGYLDRRPDACDTLDGIVGWWLYDQRLAIGRETVLAAVGALVATGAIQERRSDHGEPLYAALHPPMPPSDEE